MRKCYLTVGEELTAVHDIAEKGAWINLINPSEAELNEVEKRLNIPPDLLRAALDEEERSRIEPDDGQLLILINIPFEANGASSLTYDTIPLGIIVTENNLVTVCLKDNPLLNEFECNKNRSFFTFKKTRFVLQLLFKTATYYLRYLKQIDKKSAEIEQQLHRSMKNEELIKLLNLGKSLVYFTTSLRANGIVMEKLLRSQLKLVRVHPDPDTVITSQILKMYADDEDLLEDVITENKQAIEMCETYSNILNSTMDAFASIISNNLNIVMKFLTSVTIVLALPTMVASFFGMNVAVPLQHSPHAFLIVLLGSVLFCGIGILLLRRKNMF
ncbi:magnesium transporter [Hydrogenispora ethanolica]|uniref:Magnesium transporter n=1 Tax=Hydrogenispora ethanolica TaxID=1082276 RepID=A0A4R1R856_HYDET|nr:magnesium transporter CorA family protein [Hydrogenispora ethanolica]TCL61835.1 magnesium transporter [Hydrogenispora ethanolica]